MFGQKSGKAKLDDVNRILSELEADLKANKLSSQQKTSLLEQLKVFGRSVDDADPIFTASGLRTLGFYAFLGTDTTTSQEALRCIANALLLQPQTRQILVDLGHGSHAAEKLKSEIVDDEFLLSRILFLTTYNTNLDYAKLVQDHSLATNINSAIKRHASHYSNQDAKTSQTPPMQLLAFSETLKLIFNIMHFHPAVASHFTPSIPHVFNILQQHKISKPPLEPPVNHLINALINLLLDPPTDQSFIFPASDPTRNTTLLISLLSASLSAYPPSALDKTLTPLLTLVRRIYAFAPAAVQSSMASLLLPSPQERDKPLGRSDTLPGRLLKLTTEALTPNLRGGISALLFECSGKDATKFIENIGYGFAAGFLMSNNITIPEGAMQNHGGETNTQRQRQGLGQGSSEQAERVPVNPITGQRLDREQHVERPEMTAEEKEREAERLFVLFERLKATGVVDVQNPVEQAYRSGRIEELPDDAEDE